MILTEPIIERILGKVEIATIAKKIGGKKLKQTEKNYLYRSIRPKLAAAELLSQAKILKEINKHIRKNAFEIEYNLAAYGYEMISIQKPKGKLKKIPLEELIADILTRYSTSRYIEAIPILMIRNKINAFRLLELAVRLDIKNKIGYLLETAMMIKRLPYLEELLLYLKEAKDKKESFLAEGDYEFLAKTSPRRIRKWNLLGRFFDEDFRKNAEIYL